MSCWLEKDELVLKLRDGDFLGGPVAKSLRSQCRGPGFDP